MVAGRWVIRDGAHPKTDAIAAAFNDAMRQLWSDIE